MLAGRKPNYDNSFWLDILIQKHYQVLNLIRDLKNINELL